MKRILFAIFVFVFLLILAALSEAKPRSRVGRLLVYDGIEADSITVELVSTDTVIIATVDVTSFFGFLSSNQLNGGTGIQDSTITGAQLTTAVHNLINAAGGGTITNNEDDYTIKENGSNQLYVDNMWGAIDTLAASATPDISGSQVFVATSAQTITNFTNSPNATTYKTIKIQVAVAGLTVTNGTLACEGGINLAPESGDIVTAEWQGSEWYLWISKFSD